MKSKKFMADRQPELIIQQHAAGILRNQIRQHRRQLSDHQIRTGADLGTQLFNSFFGQPLGSTGSAFTNHDDSTTNPPASWCRGWRPNMPGTR